MCHKIRPSIWWHFYVVKISWKSSQISTWSGSGYCSALIIDIPWRMMYSDFLPVRINHQLRMSWIVQVSRSLVKPHTRFNCNWMAGHGTFAFPSVSRNLSLSFKLWACLFSHFHSESKCYFYCRLVCLVHIQKPNGLFYYSHPLSQTSCHI